MFKLLLTINIKISMIHLYKRISLERLDKNKFKNILGIDRENILNIFSNKLLN